MNNSLLVISDISVTQDSEGRYCLNDLHKASGGAAKYKPSEYLRNQKAKDLIFEIELEAGNTAIKTIKARGATGTYACKELVYAYAMWISPTFHLRVIRAYDAMVSRPAPAVDPMQALNDPVFMRGMLLTYSEKVIALEGQVEVLEPKAKALERLAIFSEGSYCIRDSAKMLQVQERQLIAWLLEHKWAYRTKIKGNLTAYADPALKMGYMEHKVTSGDKNDGSGTQWTNSQVRITSKGLTKLAQLVNLKETA